MPEMCACGKPLHYTDPDFQKIVEKLVAIKGPLLKVCAGGRCWLIPRHYIALHGVKSVELPFLGFEEVPYDYESQKPS